MGFYQRCKALLEWQAQEVHPESETLFNDLVWVELIRLAIAPISPDPTPRAKASAPDHLYGHMTLAWPVPGCLHTRHCDWYRCEHINETKWIRIYLGTCSSLCSKK